MSVHALHNRAVFQRYVLTFGVNHLIQRFFAEQFRGGSVRVVHTVKQVVKICKNVVKSFSVKVDADCRNRFVADRISCDRLVVPPVDLNAFDKSGYRVFQALSGVAPSLAMAFVADAEPSPPRSPRMSRSATFIFLNVPIGSVTSSVFVISMYN